MAEEAGENGFAYGIDLSDGMVKARTNLDKFGVTNAEIIQSEMESLPLNDNSVNVTISNCTINHSSNKEAVWSEVFRVLKPRTTVVSDIYATAPIADEYRNDPQAKGRMLGRCCNACRIPDYARRNRFYEHKKIGRKVSSYAV